MLYRRFAAASGLLLALVLSQAPEFLVQYRQRLGGALDELQAAVTRFDQETAAQSLTREQGLARLQDNADPLAQGRGEAMANTVARADRLTRQREAFRTAGPLSQYAIFAEDFDPGLARRTAGDFQPAAPLTAAGLTAAVVGFLIGWLGLHGLALPFRRRNQSRPAHAAGSVPHRL